MISFFNDVARKHYDAVILFAAKHAIIEDLWEQIAHLENLVPHEFGVWGCVALTKDFSPLSFSFQICHTGDTSKHGMNGGLIYSGPTDDDGDVRLDGSGPAFTVSLGEPKIGWSIHT